MKMAYNAVLGWVQKALYASTATSIMSTSNSAPSTATSALSITSAHMPQFTVPPESGRGAHLLPNIKDPTALDAQSICPGYKVRNIVEHDLAIEAELVLAGEPCDVYGNDVLELTLRVSQQSEWLNIHITPKYISEKNESWFKLDPRFVPKPDVQSGTKTISDLNFTWWDEPTFQFQIIRNSTQDVLFNTNGTKLVFEDQFIELVSSAQLGYNLYGLGETIHGLRLGNNLTRTIYACDSGNPVDANIYGSHPFALFTTYEQILPDGVGSIPVFTPLNTTTANGDYISTNHGFWLRNAHGLEFVLNKDNVTTRTIGGDLDLYFFPGPTQKEVTQQYLRTIGLPAMQQYWTLGFHQCRWGYANWSETRAVVDNYAAAGIPLETIWNDIDYMKAYRDFENDPIRFDYETGQEFLEQLHQKGQHYIPIVDSAIYVPNPSNQSDAYPVFNYGNDTGSFILNPDGSLYIGAVWPGYTVFPDWHTSAAQDWWQRQMLDYLKKIPADGIWIDMSEVASFCVGSCGSGNLSLNPVHPYFGLPGEPGNVIYDYPEGFNVTNATEAAAASSSSILQAAANSATQPSIPVSTTFLRTKPTPGERNVNYPPYVLNNHNGDLAGHTISPNATHHSSISEYDVHNLWGHQILQSTYAALIANESSKRPFIIGRSTFVGSGVYAGHWGGDNYATWQSMYFSIPQALSFSLFGIPMFGADACGFAGNTDAELCSRWMQLAAFFPFYRNHNVLSAISQEAYVWSSVATATKTAMEVRFQLLPYLYTLFYKAHTQGDTVMRAMAWEFPHLPYLADADRQFFLGPSILVTPVLLPGVTSVDGVFPGLVEGTDVYYDWYYQTRVPTPVTKNTTIYAPLGHIPVYIRGGAVLGLQPMKMTTREARQSEWCILVALDVHGNAEGMLYLDDGVSLKPDAIKIVTMTASSKVDADTGYSRINLDINVQGDFIEDFDHPIANITVLGVKSQVATSTPRINGLLASGDVEYDGVKQRLIVSGLQGIWAGRAWNCSWELAM